MQTNTKMAFNSILTSKIKIAEIIPKMLKNTEIKYSVFNGFFIKIISIGIIGINLSYLYEYPYISILKKIKYFDFIERMEGILSLEYLCCFFFLISFLSMLIKEIFIDIKKNIQK